MKRIVVLSALLLGACGTQPPAPVLSGYGGKSHSAKLVKPYSGQQDMVTSALDEFTLSHTQETPQMAPSMPAEYLVKRGDSVESIARSHGVSVDRLRLENGLGKTEILAINQKILLPTSSNSYVDSQYRFTQVERPLPQANPIIERPQLENEVQSLENEALAAASSVLGSVKNSSSDQPQKKVEKIKEDIVRNTIVSPAKKHTVKSGENIFRIGLKYGVSQFDIMAANDIAKPQSLRVGQVLKIPAKGEVKISDIAPAAGPEMMKPAYLTKKHRKKGLIWPAEGKVIKRFGKAGEGVNNTGINILLPKNSPIMAADDGQVIYSDNGLESYGNLILIRHKNGLVTAYAHNDRNMVKRNEKVRKGQVIAFAGDSGNVGQSQLHFEVRKNSQAINPTKVLPRL